MPTIRPRKKAAATSPAGFRVELDLYANVRPARTRKPFLSNMKAGKTMDLVIMREATEGFYPDRNMARGWGEMMPSPDMALSVRKITRHCCDRIARRAFELAMKRRKKVTAIHKANSFHMTDGLFLECCPQRREGVPGGRLDDLLVDASTAISCATPSASTCWSPTNFYGDILSDLASELSGSLGLAGSIMAGDTLCCAQAQHGSAPDIAEPGQGESDVDDPVVRHAARLAWRDPPAASLRAGLSCDRRRDRHRPRRSGLADAGSRREDRNEASSVHSSPKP